MTYTFVCNAVSNKIMLKEVNAISQIQRIPVIHRKFSKDTHVRTRQNQQFFSGFDPIERLHLSFGKYDRVFETNGHCDFCLDVFGQILDVDVIKQSEKLVFIFV